MLRRSLIALAFLAVPTMAFAQGGGGMGGGGQGRGMGAMSPIKVVIDHAADLKLTADQTKKLEDLDKSLAEQNKQPMADMQKAREAQDRDAMMAARQTMTKNNQAAQEKLKDILNADQLEAATKAIQDAMPQRGRRGGGGGH